MNATRNETKLIFCFKKQKLSRRALALFGAGNTFMGSSCIQAIDTSLLFASVSYKQQIEFTFRHRNVHFRRNFVGCDSRFHFIIFVIRVDGERRANGKKSHRTIFDGLVFRLLCACVFIIPAKTNGVVVPGQQRKREREVGHPIFDPLRLEFGEIDAMA